MPRQTLDCDREATSFLSASTKHSAMQNNSVDRLTSLRSRLTDIREESRLFLDRSGTGLEAAALISRCVDDFLLELIEEACQSHPSQEQDLMRGQTAVIALGGSGRCEMAPFSDVDLIFVHGPSACSPFKTCVSRVVRDCWDAGMTLGHSVRSVAESIADANRDPHLATSLVDARYLWGNPRLVQELKRRHLRTVVQRRRDAFIEDCLAAREQERQQCGAAVQQLEPDVKRSMGGLRDLHLIRWIGFARFGTTDIEPLLNRGETGDEDIQKLLAAHEFLTRIRFELHLSANKAQDTLTRSDQARLAAERGITALPGQLPVERFMQDYFHHSTAIAQTAKRVVRLHRPRSRTARLASFLVERRVGRRYRTDSDELDLSRRFRKWDFSSLEEVLDLYHLAALHRVNLSPAIEERIKQFLARSSPGLSQEVTERFLAVLALTGRLGTILRSMYETGVLELIVPEMRHARCLLQFNQYHSYTVDEHTLQAVAAAEQFGRDDGPLSTAYQSIRHKEILHLALLLHDLGKGYDRDHSDVGLDIAKDVANRFQLPERLAGMLEFLVHKHLLMSHLGLRRDTADADVLVRFSHEVGSPETLRMLYVLTAADFTAVGPGVWTDWKAELLESLYDRAMFILSGHHPAHLEQRLLDSITEELHTALPSPALSDAARSCGEDESGYINKQLASFSPHYLTATAPARIAADLEIIRGLKPGEIVVEGEYDAVTGTVDYRVIADKDYARGCFHRLAGVLTAKRLQILSAAINTTMEGTVVDVFRVVDGDFVGRCPDSRRQEVADAIRAVLKGHTTVLDLFQTHKRFGADRTTSPVSPRPARVVIDNDSSDRRTVIDVFAHDRVGLLYTIARTIFQLGLSIDLAKIATHFDQVVDVFYVVDETEKKIVDEDRLDAIQRALEYSLAEFEDSRHKEFR